MYTSSDPKKGSLVFLHLKNQILGKGIAPSMLIEKIKLSQIWRAPKKIKLILKNKQIKLDLPTFCYFLTKKFVDTF